MGYERNDRGFGRDYRGTERGYGDRGYGDRYGRDEDRGFFDRAGDEVRSWFGDEEAERRRRLDEMADERYERDRYARGEMGGYRSPDRYPSWARSNRDDGYSHRAGAGAPSYYAVRYDRGDDSGYARDTHNYGARYGSDHDNDTRTYYRDRARHESDYARGSAGRDNRAYGAGYMSAGADGDHDGYHSWRDRQVSALDRDYDEYRREHRQRFENEFATWRTNRQTQRNSLNEVKEHQEVVGSDGGHVGTVDHVRADHILLTKTDKDAGGHHHSIPSSWIATVADKVTLTRTAEEAKRAWRDAEERGGLFGGGRDETDTNHQGRRNLDRSFSGTY